MTRDWDETSCLVCVVSTQSHPIHMSIFNFLSSHICRAAAGQSDHKQSIAKKTIPPPSSNYQVRTFHVTLNDNVTVLLLKKQKKKPAKRKLTEHNQSVPLRLSQLSQLINNFSLWRQTIQITNSGFNNYWLPAAYCHAPIKPFTNV